MSDFLSNLFSGFGQNAAQGMAPSAANTLASTDSSLFPSVFNGMGASSGIGSNIGSGIGSDFKDMFSNINVPSSSMNSGGGLFSGMNFDDLVKGGGLALGGLQYRQNQMSYDHQKSLQDKEFRREGEDRAYNKSVRERARNLRF